jgi:hypothetical protein
MCTVHRCFFSFTLNNLSHLLQNKFPHSSFSCVVSRRERPTMSVYRQMGRDEMGRKHAPVLDREGENMGWKEGVWDRTVRLHHSQISRKFKKCCPFLFPWPSSILCWSSYGSYKTEPFQSPQKLQTCGKYWDEIKIPCVPYRHSTIIMWLSAKPLRHPVVWRRISTDSRTWH